MAQNPIVRKEVRDAVTQAVTAMLDKPIAWREGGRTDIIGALVDEDVTEEEIVAWFAEELARQT